MASREGVIAVSSLLRRSPELRLADPSSEPERPPSLLMNGITGLPLSGS